MHPAQLLQSARRGERLEGPRIGAMDVFQIAAKSSSKASRTFQAVAYVDVNAGELMKFAETVAVNHAEYQ